MQINSKLNSKPYDYLYLPWQTEKETEETLVWHECYALEVTDLINGQLGALWLLIASKTLLDVQQNSITKLPHFQGAFLAIGKAGEYCKVSLIETSFLNTV